MTKWTVEAAAAMNSLKSLQTQAGGFEGIGTKYNNGVTTAATQASMSGKGGPIGVALGEFAEKWKDSLTGMVKHTGDVLGGTSKALTALANGQQQMALIAQRGIQRTEGVDPRDVIRKAAAAAAPPPERPSPQNRAV